MDTNLKKQEITSKLPNDVGELNWIIKYVGQAIFGDTWENFEPTLIGNAIITVSKDGANIINELFRKDNDLTKVEVNELLNHLFSESLDKKSKIIK